ncbi:uncharacterized protein LOC126209936 [Schistocerca nitens]|uniref:uncharacterized protein LOC126209936 n=1 Tax=Schistocerca nitens TaxID=7011 RepID=UPI002119770E|nr:uncharacterized protein LOC126209936 [Schistocerca nitens]
MLRQQTNQQAPSLSEHSGGPPPHRLGSGTKWNCVKGRSLWSTRRLSGRAEDGATRPVALRNPISGSSDCREGARGDLVRGGFQPRLPTSLPLPGQQQQQPSPLPRRQPVPLMPPAQLHTGAPRVVAPAPAVPLQSPPPSEQMDVDPSAGPPSQAVAVQPVLQPLSLGTPKESDTAAPCPAPTQQPSTQRQETLPLFVGPDAPSRPVPEAAPVVTGVHPDLGFQSVFPEAPRSQCWASLEPPQLSSSLSRHAAVLERPRTAGEGPTQASDASGCAPCAKGSEGLAARVCRGLRRCVVSALGALVDR